MVIAGAALLFIAGVSLLVYFYRRYRRIEKEPEEDWDHSRRSLFVNAAPPSPKPAEISSNEAALALEPAAEMAPAPTGGTREFASEQQPQPSIPSASAPSPPVEAPTPPIQTAAVDSPREQRQTQVLASPSPIEAGEKPEPERESGAFDDEVWADLEVAEQPHAGEHVAGTVPLRSESEPPRVARVEERSHREPFESPRIERITHREPFEPPSIEPLVPHNQAAATRELRSSPPPAAPRNMSDTTNRPERNTVMFGTESSSPAREARTRAAEPVVASAHSYRSPAGSVLGLPAEASHKPLILGEPVRSDSEAGIGVLSNYGKDLSPKAGRAGTIALLIVVVLLGGAAATYFFVPSVHSRVGGFIARLRGTDTQAVDTKPRAQIFPSFRPEVNGNMVTARGAIDNISDAPLENLEIEVSLQRGSDAPSEIRRIAVTPNPLPANQRGTFEFEYDGKRDTGFASYKITKLFSNGTEIKFRAPNQK